MALETVKNEPQDDGDDGNSPEPMSTDNRVLTLKVQPTGTEKNKASELLDNMLDAVN